MGERQPQTDSSSDNLRRTCDVCGAPADGRCRVDTADGPMLGYLCDRDAEDMAALLDEWEPFEAAPADDRPQALVDLMDWLGKQPFPVDDLAEYECFPHGVKGCKECP